MTNEISSILVAFEERSNFLYKMAVSKTLQVSLGVLLLTFVLSANSQLFRGRSQRINQRSYSPPCLFRSYCKPETVTTTTEYPWWEASTTTTTTTEEPFIPPFQPSPEVDFLAIAETCAANFITQDYNEGWEERLSNANSFLNTNRWPVRLTNKLFVYLMAYNMYESNGLEITENQLEKSACFLTTLKNGWSITNTTGFNGKSVQMRLVRTTLPKVFRFSLNNSPVGALTGTASVILSDNFGYTVFEYCFDNGLRTFAMFGRSVASGDIDAIKLHLKAIGFKDRHMIDLNPDENCEISDGEASGWFPPKAIDWRIGFPTYDLPTARPPSQKYYTFISNNSLLPHPPFFWKKK